VLLDHQVGEYRGALSYTWDFDAGLLPEGLMESMFEAYNQLLSELCSDEGQWNA